MKHLTSDQISAIVAGWSRNGEHQQHVSSCSVCSAEVERLREVLTLFRASVRDWSDNNSRAPLHLVRPSGLWSHPELLPPRRVAWFLAAAALAIAVAVPVYHDVKERELKAQAYADYLLIESVQNQLSRSAPVAMQPLMQLIPSSESEQNVGTVDRKGQE